MWAKKIHLADYFRTFILIEIGRTKIAPFKERALESRPDQPLADTVSIAWDASPICE